MGDTGALLAVAGESSDEAAGAGEAAPPEKEGAQREQSPSRESRDEAAGP